MGEAIIKQPGIVKVAIGWLFLGILNIWVAYQGISSNISGWDLVSDLLSHEWLRIALPAELGLFIAILLAALFQLMSIPGLPKGKILSFKLALGAPTAIGILSLTLGLLYASAPPELSELQSSRVIVAFVFGAFQMGSVFVFWRYLNRPEGKFFLKIMQQQSAAKEKTVKLPNQKLPEDEIKFYCRYCGSENKVDAIFCERCGRQLKEI